MFQIISNIHQPEMQKYMVLINILQQISETLIDSISLRKVWCENEACFYDHFLHENP